MNRLLLIAASKVCDATPEMNGNGEHPNKGETSGDEVAQWAEDEVEETED
jgi:hypothetical protein